MQKKLLQTLSGDLDKPGGAVQPLEASGIDTINKSSDALTTRLARFQASRGFSKSGTLNENKGKLEADRVGQIAQFEGGLTSTMLNQKNLTLAQALSAAFHPQNTTTTSVAPGNTGAGALSGGFTSLNSAINQALAGGA